MTSPSGSSEPCTVQDRTENNYSIRFVPREMGLHMVTVRHKGLHVSGSDSITVIIGLIFSLVIINLVIIVIL